MNNLKLDSCWVAPSRLCATPYVPRRICATPYMCHAVYVQHRMNHSIEWSLKKKIQNEISKVEVWKSNNFQSQKMFEYFLSVQRDQRVSSSSSSSSVVSMYWMIHSSTHIEWSLKKKIQNEISKVEVWKSKNFQSQKMIAQKLRHEKSDTLFFESLTL